MRADPSPRAGPDRVARPAGGAPGSTRAVLAEDSALFREGLTRLLTDAGYDVVATAADAGELLAQVRGHRPDVVVTDIRMPPTHTNEGWLRRCRSGPSSPAWPLWSSPSTWRPPTP
jgi:CheY-like chemotaxis protein